VTARLLLDTNICIYVLGDAQSEAARRLGECRPGEAAASVISYAEVLRGVAGGSRRDLAKVRRFFDLVPILPFDAAAAQTYARMPFKRGSYDRLIAAHALSRGLVLVTNNGRDFAGLEGLVVDNWQG
jgi:tRNA(fMet)-specific endonuclease VapC